ncbi:NAD(P)-binding protein [Tilletiaria anomala UBC 951]|uniref:NAD(P)-binding protein n=1 Tax=Tilletiaria anomala (strain ATCC 24038 / CBS 436.72 / UBC 951) TaxID=1037660 RepID=A0A066VJB7_TILAU|nr:NAD(P)-binding protein [Tilletiaria anomala UBC 951]KDN38700.1 NAD(P)-binding protein [Tilletiaria anomala UBC 951]
MTLTGKGWGRGLTRAHAHPNIALALLGFRRGSAKFSCLSILVLSPSEEAMLARGVLLPSFHLFRKTTCPRLSSYRHLPSPLSSFGYFPSRKGSLSHRTTSSKSGCSSRLPLSAETSAQVDQSLMSLFSTNRLHDKVVLITGASAGIGRATAVLFARAGANVVLTARRTEKLDDAVKECEEANKQGASGKGGKYVAVELDVQKRSNLDALIGQLPDWAKQVDILVNNAGLVFGTEKVGEINADEVDVMIQTNVTALIHLTQIFVREFKKRQRGHVINLGSIAGREAYPGGSIYCATKFAVKAFTSALMKELVDTPIRVTCIDPGMVNTEFSTVRFRGDKATADKVYEGLQPLTGQDIAEEIVWAANRPEHVNIAESLIFPVNQASPYHNHRPNLKK